jgi:ketosteroid isomerase-like protein
MLARADEVKGPQAVKEGAMSRAEITAVNRSFEDAVRKGDAETMASLYTTDGIVLPPDAPMAKGPGNIIAVLGVRNQRLGVEVGEAGNA